MIVAVDTNIFIYLLEGAVPFVTLTEQLFNAAEQGTVQAVASDLAIAELLSKPMDSAMATQLLADARSLTVDFKDVSIDCLLQAAQIRRERDIKLPDAIHVASAIIANADCFVTNDENLLRKANLGIRLVPLNGVSQLLARM